MSGLPVGIEAKYMQKLSLQAAHLKQARLNAGNLPWVLALREAKSGKRLVVLDYNHYLKMYHSHYNKENN